MESCFTLCRLCAGSDPDGNLCIYQIDEYGNCDTTLSNVLNNFFSINIRPDDHLSITICRGCKIYIDNHIAFIQKVEATQKVLQAFYDSSKDYCDESNKGTYNVLTEKLKMPQTSIKLNVNDDESWDLISQSSYKENIVYTGVVEKPSENNYSDNKNESDAPSNLLKAFIEEFDYDEALDHKNDALLSTEQIDVTEDCSHEDNTKHPLDINQVPDDPGDSLFECSACKKCFKKLRACAHHMIYVHNMKAFEIDDHVCSLCQRTFKTANELLSHMEREHQDVNAVVNADAQTNRYSCHCGKSYKSLADLNAHRLVHNNANNAINANKFQCINCGKGFKTKTHLQMHMKIHEDTKHICEICNLELKSKRTLQNHMVVHSASLRYKCKICSFQYRRKEPYRCHLLNHLGMRPYKCPYCIKSFSASTNLGKHKLRKHQANVEEDKKAGREEKRCVSSLKELEQQALALTQGKRDDEI